MLLLLKIYYVKEGDGMNTKKFLDQLNGFGIDTTIGLRYCGDEEMYREILAISCEASVDKIKRIKKAFQEEDYENYKILVHSAKSSTANMGAMELSEMAKALEYAGINGDCEFIRRNHLEFIEYYEQLTNKLSELIYINDMGECLEDSIGEAAADDEMANYTKENRCGENVKASEIISRDQLDELTQGLLLQLRELELDEAESIARKLLSYKLPDEHRLLVEKLIIKLQNFDVEGAKEIVCHLSV